MGFFSVLRTGKTPAIELEKLDVNLWVMPGVLDRRVIYCDVGLKVAVTSAPPADAQGRLVLTVGVPASIRGAVRDLVPVMRDRAGIAELVFGNYETVVARAAGSSLYRCDDGQSSMLLMPLDDGASRQLAVARGARPYTTYEITSAEPVEAGATYYLRFRFVLDQSGAIWNWQRFAGRRAFVLGDLRVNEFRELPSLNPSAGFRGSALNADIVNLFVIVSSRLREQRVSPAVRYVRPIERDSWDSYLERRLSTRKDETFLAYYWRGLDVSQSKPFRGFIELERRRPRLGWTPVVAALVIVAAVLAVTPVGLLQYTLIGQVLAMLQGLTLPVVGAGTLVLAAVRLAPRVLPAWRFTARLVDRYEERRYRLPGPR